MIAIIDYGAGNLFSVKNALNHLGTESIITSSAEELEKADKLILPGVGAFPDAMKKLNDSGLVEVIKKEAGKNKPLLGICLGMQMLFDESLEFGTTAGLGLIPGKVTLMTPNNPDLLIPQIGWNELEVNHECALLKDIPPETYVYFVHSFAAECDEKYVSAYCDYGGKVTALAFSGNVFGCQFHPEKSGEAGLKIVKNFIEL